MSDTLSDFLFGHTVTRDQLGYLGGDPHFRPPAPSVPAGHVDIRGVMVSPPPVVPCIHQDTTAAEAAHG